MRRLIITVQLRSHRPALGALSVAVSALLGGAAGAPAYAQGDVEEITVTGSRIVRRDFEANSPILTVDADRFEETSNVAIEAVVNQLPQFVPAVSQFSSGGTFAGSQRTPSAATLSLRGLGANRNLVLIDGRRAMPVNASMAVSINTIPSAAIARIETITGGASSVYGADAVAGVVNFIMKRDFEGVDLDVQAGQTMEEDGEEFRISGLMGANVADGRGNVMFGFERSYRGEILRVDREFYRNGFEDPYSDNGGSFWSAAGYTANAANPHSPAVQDAIFGISPITGAPVGRTGTFYMNPDGTLYKTSRDGTYRYAGGTEQPGTGLPWRYLDAVNGNLRENQVTTLAQIPLERYSLFARGHMDVSDSVTAFAQYLYSESSSRATGSDSPMLGGWRTAIPHSDGIYEPSLGADGNTVLDYLAGGRYGLSCAPVGGCTKSEVFPTPPELTALLDSRANPEADFDVVQSTVWAGARRSYIDTTSHYIVAGFEGSFPFRDWTWEAYGSSGSTRTESAYGGAISVERWRFALSQPNYGRGLFYTGNQYGGGFAAGTITCATGFAAVYGVSGYTEGQTPSDDCQRAVGARSKANGHMKQNVAEFNMQGSAAELWAGDLRFALGTSYRVNKYEYFPDTLNTQESVLDQSGGFFPTGEAIGKTDVKELYGELLLPLLNDKPGARSLSLELGYRNTDNDPSDDVHSYKALVDWQIVDRVRLRGGRQIANRAPNIGELFQAAEQFAPFTVVQGDPCSTRDPAQLPFTANPAINGERALRVRALCEQLMGPQGAATFYGDPNNQPNTLQNARISNLRGNPQLRSEQAETVTAGIVANITDRSTLSVDYWRIRIKDMIAEEFGDVLYRACLSEDTNPVYDPLHPACLRLVRDPNTGSNSTISTTFTNEQQVDLAGWDVQFDWNTDIGPGTLSINALATITDHTKTRAADGAEWFDFKGTSGPSNIQSINPYSFDYRLFTMFGYRLGAWNASLRWRHLPSIQSEAAVRTLVSLEQPTGAYDIFDSAVRWAFRDQWELRFGIDNLLDVEPEITFREQGGYSGAGETNANFYDILGRRYYAGITMRF